MNKTSAKEWLEKAWHNLSGAKVLYDANHYSDIVAVELHYAVEKTLKTFLAYENSKISKTHDLEKIYYWVNKYINLDDTIDLLEQITKYHIEEAYPTFDRPMPSYDELVEVFDFANYLFEHVCKILDIDIETIKNS